MAVNTVGDTVAPVEVFSTSEVQSDAIQIAGIYGGEVTKLTEHERALLELLANIKLLAVGYVQGSVFLDQTLHPPEPTPGHTVRTHSVEVGREDDGPVIHRTALLTTSVGNVLLDVGSNTDEESLRRLYGSDQAAQRSGWVTNSGGFSDAHRNAVHAYMSSGLESAADARRAVVTFRLVREDDDPAEFVLDGNVEMRPRGGRSFVEKGQGAIQLLDMRLDVVDVALFEALEGRLAVLTGKRSPSGVNE